jgi:hypothetical protein
VGDTRARAATSASVTRFCFTRHTVLPWSRFWHAHRPPRIPLEKTF